MEVMANEGEIMEHREEGGKHELQPKKESKQRNLRLFDCYNGHSVLSFPPPHEIERGVEHRMSGFAQPDV